METGNITHEQIKIKDAKEACVKVGGIVGRNSCNWSLDVVIDGEVYTDIEICYHCQLEKEFTPEKAFDLFDYGVSVFVLCNPKEDGSIERKVIGLVPSYNDPYPKLCGLKRFFAKIQQVDSNGEPIWEDQIDPLVPPKPICKYYWIFFDDDGSIRTEEVKNDSFMSQEELINLLEDISSLFNKFADGSLSLIGLADALYDLMNQHANATAILDRVTDIPEGSDSVFTKAFMMHVRECEQRYVAEQHLLMKDRQIKFDQGVDFPLTNCTYVHHSPPNRFYCNVDTGDMVWSHIIQQDCPIFLGMTLHVNLLDGSIGNSYPFDCNGHIDYFAPPENYNGDIYGYYSVLSTDDAPLDLIPEITNIEETVISGYMNYLSRPMNFTFDVVTGESHWTGGAEVQDSEHMMWTEKGFETAPSWHFEQKINPTATGDHSDSYHDDGDYGPINNWNDDTAWFRAICNACNNQSDTICCSAKCHHCATIANDQYREWTQEANGESHVTFNALSISGKIDDMWNEISSDKEGHGATFMACDPWYDSVQDEWDCEYGGSHDYSDEYGGKREGNRNYKYKESHSYKVAWINNNVTYIEKQITRLYHNRSLLWDAYHDYQGVLDNYGYGHCGGPNVDDFASWTELSSECLKCIAGVPDFEGPLLDFPGWPAWPEGYNESISYNTDGSYWHFTRGIYIDDFDAPYVREFDMGDGITFDIAIYEIPYYLDDRSTDPSAGLVVAAKGYQDYSNAAGSSHWKIYHDNKDVTDKVLDALKCDPAVLVTLGMV